MMPVFVSTGFTVEEELDGCPEIMLVCISFHSYVRCP